MDKDWERQMRDKFRRASLEDSLMDFIGSVDENEQFEGYGARFNAKCVESVTRALTEHSHALRDHQHSVDQVRGALGNIQRLLLVLAISGVAIAISSFFSGQGNASEKVSQGTPQINGQFPNNPPVINNNAAGRVHDASATELNGQVHGSTPQKADSDSGLANDSLLKPASHKEKLERIKMRSTLPPPPEQPDSVTPNTQKPAVPQSSSPAENANSQTSGLSLNPSNTSAPSSSPYSTPGVNRHEKPNYGGSSIPGESAWDRWKK